MQKVSYMGDGSTTEFTFNFPYFENTNIVVTKNNTTATGYNIVGTSAAPDADIPYIGGKVVFETAPTSLDSITIARNLPLTRVVDYQPTAKLESTTLNQDANYLMEVIKDRKDELDTLVSQYADIANKESTTTLLAQITTIHNEIVAIDAKITALGDISTLRQSVTTNSNNITTLDNRTTNLLDYVIASQAPTADNNYTWYRKYKSGWVEIGQKSLDLLFNTPKIVTLPVTMADTNYYTSVQPAHITSSTIFASASTVASFANTTTSILLGQWNTASANLKVSWEVKGMAS